MMKPRTIMTVNPSFRAFILIAASFFLAPGALGYAELLLKVVDASERPLTGVSFTWKPGGGYDFGGTAGAVGFSLNNMANGTGDYFYRLSEAAPQITWSPAVRDNLVNWKIWLNGDRPYWGTLKIARSGYVPKEVRLEATDSMFYWRRIQLREIPTISTGGEIDREDYVRPGIVSATVTDSRGAVSGALVRVTTEWGSVSTGTTNTSGTVNITITDPGRFTAVVEKTGYTSSGSRTGAAYPGETAGVTFSITSTETPPSITAQPQGATVFPGATVTFSVTATGTPPLFYQWKKDTNDIAGATGSTYTISAVSTGDFGGYSVVVSNNAKSVTSSTATLKAGEPPRITAWVGNTTLNVGNSTSFYVTVSGTEPFTYQWSKNGSPIVGATSSTLRISSAQLSDAGTYSVTVTNPGGSAVQPGAVLTVNDPGTGGGVTTSISPQSHLNVSASGASNTVAVTASGNWTASSNSSWITVTSGGSGTGNGTVTYNVSANTGAARDGSLTIAGIAFPVTQLAGSPGGGTVTTSISPQSDYNVAADGASNRLIAVSSNGTWTARSNDTWITINSGSSGNGNGTVSYTIAANTGPARSGSLTIGDINVPVSQAGAAGPVVTYALSSTSASIPASGGSGSVSVTVSGGAGSWTARSNSPEWITITGGANGAASGTVTYSVAANPLPSSRQGTIAIAGYTFTISQTSQPAAGGNLNMGNTSTRVQVGTGANVLITGIVLSGTGTKRYLVRAAGPALTTLGVPGALTDPELSVLNGSVELAANDNWDSSLASTMESVGAFAFARGSRDSALVVTLGAGAYTVQVKGVGGTTGVGLVEIYELP